MTELLEKRKVFEKKQQKLSEYKNKQTKIEELENQIKQLQDKLEIERKELEEIKIS